MADDSMRRGRQRAARAFIARRRELGLTQPQVARLAGVAVRTVSNFENGRWPNAHTRMLLEKAIGWAAGQIDRLSSPRAYIDTQLLDRVRELDADEREWMIGWLEGLRGEVRGHPGGG